MLTRPFTFSLFRQEGNATPLYSLVRRWIYQDLLLLLSACLPALCEVDLEEYDASEGAQPWRKLAKTEVHGID